MKTLVFLFILVLLIFHQNLSAQNTLWDIIYCLNGGENKSVGISKLSFPNPAEKPGWKLIFNDEFQTDSLDPEKWNRSTPNDDGNGSCLRGFGMNPANTAVGSGQAQIFNTIDPKLPDCPYSFGEIKTMSVRDTNFASFYFYAPGYLETRVKLLNKTGQGAACWLWGVGTPEHPGTPGPWNEIDIFELNGVNSNIFNGAFHWTYHDVHVSQNHSIYLTDSSQIYDLSANWTTFGLEWDTAVIKWFVNNQLVKELDLTGIPPFCIPAANYSQPLAPFCVRFNTGNNSVGNQAGTPNPADFPQSMLVDYVRVYKKSGNQATPIIVPDGHYQICSTATSPESSVRIIRSNYYPDVTYHWSSPAFELSPVASLIPQPPGNLLVWIKPGIMAGQAYPIFLETHFPGNLIEHDTCFLYIASDAPGLPPDDFVAAQVDTTCRFTITTPAPHDMIGCEFRVAGDTAWSAGKIIREEAISKCVFGIFKPDQLVEFAFRIFNACDYSPIRYSSLIMPVPIPGCKWPTGMEDSLHMLPGTGKLLLSISPNPVTNIMRVRILSPSNLDHKKLHLTIHDVDGRRVANETLSGLSAELDLSHLHQGVYCLQILEEQRIISKTIFMKK